MLIRRNPFARPRSGDEILSGVHLLGSQRVNFYAITEGRSVTLVDCGFDGHRRYLEAWLARTGRRISDIEAVVLTHGHADHVGFAERLRQRGVPVYLDMADTEFATHPSGRQPPQRLKRSIHRSSALSFFAEAVFDGVFLQPVLKQVLPFEHGKILDVPGQPTVIPIPGHSAGSVAFHLEAQDALLSGDALMTRDPMFGGKDCALVFAEHTDRDEEAFASLRRMEAYRSSALLPAHGEAWVQADAVGKAIDEAVIARA